MSRSNGIKVVNTYRGQSFAQGIACLWPSWHISLATWDWKKHPILKYYKKGSTNLSWHRRWKWFSLFPHLLNSLKCWLECVVLCCCGEKWTSVGDPCSYQQPSLNVENSPEWTKHTHAHLIHRDYTKYCAVNIQGPGGKSHQVIVCWLQVAVAPRLCLVRCGCSQRTFIALLVQPIYSIPDVGRIARPL